MSIARLRAKLARFQARELNLSVEADAEALLDDLFDPDDWTPEVLHDLDALRSLAQPPNVREGLVVFDQPTLIPGDLVIDGDLECQSHVLVLGDLRCTGYVFSGIHDSVIVVGDLVAAAVESLRSYWLIGGSITTETAWLSTYGILCLRGSLRTRLLVVQQDFDVRDAVIEAGVRIDTDYLPEDAEARSRLREVLDVDTCLDSKGHFDSFALLRRVARKEPVFRVASVG